MKVVKKILIAIVVVLLVMQFFPPDKNIGSSNHLNNFLVETNPSETVRGILQNACYDCHSNHTEYPWYNKIAPVSYWMAAHVNDGKKHLNFSEWDNYDLEQKAHKLEELIEEVEEGHMPLPPYLITHESARLNQDEMDALLTWAKQTKQAYSLNIQ
jgi:hypothetical protein